MTTIIQQLRDAQAAGDAVAYYSILEQNGDAYGRLAGGVVMSDALAGTVARAFAASLVKDVLNYELTGGEWAQISLGLIAEDLAARERKLLADGDPLNLGYRAIQDYHNLVFDGLGIPRDAWTANIPLNQSSDPETTWQSMLQMPDDWFWGMLSGAGSFIDTIDETLLATRYLIPNPLAPFDPPDRTTISDELYWGWHAMNAFAAATQDGWGWGTSGSVQPFSVDLPDGGKFIGGADQVDDVLAGTTGNDVIVGYRGNDILGGTYGHDHVYGGEGDDYIHAGPDGGDLLMGGTNGSDGDTVHFNGSWRDYAISTLDGGYSFTLTGSAQDQSKVFEFENYDFADVQDVDLVLGSTTSENLQGHARSDIIIAGGGDDTINAGNGDDVIEGGADDDTIDGGSGTDKAYYSGNMADYGIAIVGGTVVLSDTIHDRDGIDRLTAVEELVFADGSIVTANLPKAPTSFGVSHNNIHTHVGLIGDFYQLHLVNIADPDGGTNVLEIDASQTDPAILPYLQTMGVHARFTDVIGAGTYQIGIRTYDAANNVRSETQVLSIEVTENTAPTGIAWAPGAGSIVENSTGTVGYLRIADANSSSGGGSGEKYSVRLIGDFSHTYSILKVGDDQSGYMVRAVDAGNVDYELDANPTLTIEVMDVAGHVEVFNLDVDVQDVANTTYTTSAGATGQSRSYTGTTQDDVVTVVNSFANWTINGGAGGDTLTGGQGKDTIDGGAGADIMRGNGGNDSFKSYAGSDTIYGGTGNDTVDLSASYRPQYVDNAYMAGGFLVIEYQDTVVRIYQDVEQITIGVPWVGNLSWNLAGYLAEYNAFH